MSERTEQEALFDFLARLEGRIPELKWAFHVPNGEKRDKATAARLQRMGVRKGVPDVLLPVTRYDPQTNIVSHGLAIELKHGRGRETPEQLMWLGYLKRQGWQTATCYGWTEAARLLVRYLGGNPDEIQGL